MGLIIGLGLAFFAGLAMMEMGLTEPDFETGARVFMCVCGLIMAAPGTVLGISAIKNRSKEHRSFKEKLFGAKSFLKFIVFMAKEEVTEDGNETERLMRSFTKDVDGFFSEPGLKENSAIQNDTTQVYWNILALQKKRLNRRDLTMEYKSRRMKYGDINAVSSHKYFDGKYEITEAEETLQADRVYKKDGRKIGTDKVTQVGRYRLLNAKSVGDNMVICPSCGARSTKENLIDGCDYCGTKFTIEDLGLRVSAFGFMDDYELEYDKYCDARSRFSIWVGLLVGVPIGILSLIGMVTAATTDGGFSAGPIMTFFAIMLGTLFCTFAAVYLALVFFYFCIFPFIQAVASAANYAKKRMDNLKKFEAVNRRFEAEIKKTDPLFSVAGFLSGVQNKISTILYADSVNEATAFAEGREAEDYVKDCMGKFSNVINADVETMVITSHHIVGGMREITAEAVLRLTEYKGGATSHRKQGMTLKLSKKADCHTQAVCGPSFMKCPGCGAPISLLDGKKCSYCGSIKTVSDKDWAITGLALK